MKCNKKRCKMNDGRYAEGCKFHEKGNAELCENSGFYNKERAIRVLGNDEIIND